MKRISCTVLAAQLVSFLAVLIAIVILSLAPAKPDLSITTGLVGVLGGLLTWRTSAEKHPGDGQ